jgi:hypothetical protein
VVRNWCTTGTRHWVPARIRARPAHLRLAPWRSTTRALDPRAALATRSSDIDRARTRIAQALLDAFTERDLDAWSTRSVDLQSYADRVYYDLERQPAARYDEPCAALRTIPATSISLDGWVRVTDWLWSLTPLSPLGSIKGIGGRFNIGDDLDRNRGQAFPCLYLAHDIDTAYREYSAAPSQTGPGS